MARARYRVDFFCDECGETHPMGITVMLNDGPADPASIGDTYRGRDLPRYVAMLINNEAQCPETGRMTTQADNDQVFIVPIGD